MGSLTAAWYSTEYQEISKIVDEIMNAGFSAEQILSQVSKTFCLPICSTNIYTYPITRCMTIL